MTPRGGCETEWAPRASRWYRNLDPIPRPDCSLNDTIESRHADAGSEAMNQSDLRMATQRRGHST